jgi:hypothetical protein
MSLLERIRSWKAERRLHSDEDLEAEIRGEVHDSRSGKRDRRGDQFGPEEMPGAADAGLRGPRGDLGR